MTRLLRRLLMLFRWRQQERDLHDELSAHVAMDAQERIEAGAPPDFARAGFERAATNRDAGRPVTPGLTPRPSRTAAGPYPMP